MWKSLKMIWRTSKHVGFFVYFIWKCISIPLRPLVPSTKLPCKCYTMQTFPNLFIVSLTNPVKETRTRRHFTWQATCYIILRVRNLVCYTKSDAESKRQEVAENCIMRKLATCPFPQTAVYLGGNTGSHLCCEIHARQQLSCQPDRHTLQHSSHEDVLQRSAFCATTQQKRAPFLGSTKAGVSTCKTSRKVS